MHTIFHLNSHFIAFSSIKRVSTIISMLHAHTQRCLFADVPYGVVHILQLCVDVQHKPLGWHRQMHQRRGREGPVGKRTTQPLSTDHVFGRIGVLETAWDRVNVRWEWCRSRARCMGLKWCRDAPSHPSSSIPLQATPSRKENTPLCWMDSSPSQHLPRRHSKRFPCTRCEFGVENV